MTIAPPVPDSPSAAGPPVVAALPTAESVLAVIARPGQESEELGGLLYAFRQAGASLSLLCMTRGEASPRNSAGARLEAIRPWELQLAAAVLGIGELTVASYPDGELHRQPIAELDCRIDRAIRQHRADLLLIIGPETGGRDEVAIAFAARAAAARANLPVVARTRPGVRGAWMVDLGTGAATARAIQKSAAGAHASQSEALPTVAHRLDLLDRGEPMRWLLLPHPVPPQAEIRLLHSGIEDSLPPTVLPRSAARSPRDRAAPQSHQEPHVTRARDSAKGPATRGGCRNTSRSPLAAASVAIEAGVARGATQDGGPRKTAAPRPHPAR